MLSNAGWYLTSGVGAYYFEDVEGDITKQSTFAIFGAVGSFLGLFVIPIMSKNTPAAQSTASALSWSLSGILS